MRIRKLLGRLLLLLYVILGGIVAIGFAWPYDAKPSWELFVLIWFVWVLPAGWLWWRFNKQK